jgi:hypothetical protein
MINNASRLHNALKKIAGRGSDYTSPVIAFNSGKKESSIKVH